MRIVLVTGGARAGKSSWAEAEAMRIAGSEVAYVATAEPRDEDMSRRIQEHRAARPREWVTLEEPLAVPEAISNAGRPCVLLDCLTLWVSNLLLTSGPDHDPRADQDPREAVRPPVEALLRAARTRTGTLIVVTNEVGLGVVPANPLARAYRDVLGWTNMCVANAADEVVLLVAGVPIMMRRRSASP